MMCMRNCSLLYSYFVEIEDKPQTFSSTEGVGSVQRIKMKKRDNKQCLLDTPAGSMIKDSYQSKKVREKYAYTKAMVLFRITKGNN